VRDQPIADPAIIRRLDTGQAAYIYRGGITFIQIKRLVAAPAALTGQPETGGRPGRPPGPARSAGDAPPGGADRPDPPPDAGPLLDEAFGGEPR
jgi:hypothetical protein